MTYNNMGTHLKKLWEVVGSIFKVKKVLQMLKNIPKKLPIERCGNQMKVNLKESKEIFKFESDWENESWPKGIQRKFQIRIGLGIQQGVLIRGEQSKGWNTCKTLMVLKEVGAKARGARTLMAQTYSPKCFKVKLHLKQCGGVKPKLKGCFKKWSLPRGLKLRKELLQVLWPKEHALPKAPPNRMLKIVVNIP